MEIVPRSIGVDSIFVITLKKDESFGQVEH